MRKNTNNQLGSHSKKVGLPPGSIIPIGKNISGPVSISVFDYNQEELQEQDYPSLEQCILFTNKNSVTWINIDGIHDVDLLKKAGECFNIHSLVLEDIANTAHRPKVEEFDDFLFITFKMIYRDEESSQVISEQVSLLLGNYYVISFQEKPGDLFDPIRERLKSNKGRIRKSGADYLAYCLLDCVVDNYFSIMEEMSDKIEKLDEDIYDHFHEGISHEIHALKRDLIYFRKQLWPLREVLNGLLNLESKLLRKTTRIFYRDVYDHVIQVMDTVESFRDIVSSLQDSYMTVVSNRMNEVMKVLTIIATIFIPITFVAGIYGMNFEFMPELGWKWSYFVALFVMFLIVMAMLAFFRRKKWL